MQTCFFSKAIEKGIKISVVSQPGRLTQKLTGLANPRGQPKKKDQPKGQPSNKINPRVNLKKRSTQRSTEKKDQP
jgi:hypothetical protein